MRHITTNLTFGIIIIGSNWSIIKVRAALQFCAAFSEFSKHDPIFYRQQEVPLARKVIICHSTPSYIVEKAD